MQQDLLKRKLEERKTRRKRLQDKLKDQEKDLHSSQKAMHAKQEDVE